MPVMYNQCFCALLYDTSFVGHLWVAEQQAVQEIQQHCYSLHIVEGKSQITAFKLTLHLMMPEGRKTNFFAGVWSVGHA